jgi:single-stranded DNA-binding protein
MSTQFAVVNVQGHIGSAQLVKPSEGKELLRFSVGVNQYYRGESVVNWYTVQLWNGAMSDLIRRCDGDLESLKGALITLTGKQILRPYTSNSGQAKVEVLIENASIINLSLKKSNEDSDSAPELPVASDEPVTDELPTEQPQVTRKGRKKASDN